MNMIVRPRPRGTSILASPLVISCLILAPHLAFTQEALPVAGASTASENDDTVVVLTPFEVNAKDDMGYMGVNATSGSRLNTNLADTPASVSVFTADFLEDIGAINLSDLANYALNTEFDVGYIGGEPNGNGMMTAYQSLTVRGLPTKGGPASGRTVNFLSYPIEIDLYNTDRVEFSRGPNSILFGLGQAGGTFNVQSRTANVQRSIFSTSLQVGSWNAFRGVIDANVPLIKDKLAFRFDAVAEETDGWRPWTFRDNKRAYLAFRYQPTKKTTVDLMWETVAAKFNNPRPYIGPDHISKWIEAGRPLVTPPLANSTVNPVSGIRRISSTDRWAYVWGGDSTFATPTLVNLKNSAEVVHPDFTVTGTGRFRPMIQDFSLVPKDAVLAGPGTYNKYDFDTITLQLRHEFTRNLYAELAANWMEFSNNQRDINGPDLAIRYDPNTLYTPAGGGGTFVSNPNAGKPYIDAYLQRQKSLDRRNDVRGTIAYNLDLGKIFGKHQFAALGEHWEQTTRGETLRPILFGNPSVVNNPESANNLVWQRTYVDLNGPVENIGLANFEEVNLPGVAYVALSAPSHNRYYLDSWMVATQSRFLKDRLVVTLGERRDYLRQELSTSVRDTNLAGGYTVGFLRTGPSNRFDYEASTRTAGAVLHVGKGVSVYVNRSDNVALPALNQFTLPNTPVPSPRGDTSDVGVMLNLFDNRLSARITYYETAVVNNSTSLGAGNVQDRINLIWSEMLDDGLITRPQYESNLVRANAYNFNNTAQGWEAEIVANLTPAWRLMLNASTNKTSIANVGTAVRRYVNERQDTWMAAAANNEGIAEQLELLDSWMKGNLVDREGGRDQSTPDWTINFRTNYTFRQGRLKGFDAGLGGRTRIGMFLGYTSSDPATRREITADAVMLFDANIGYGNKFKWHGKDYRFRVQLNINNLLDEDGLIPQTANQAGDIVNYRFQTPRQWVLRTTLSY